MSRTASHPAALPTGPSGNTHPTDAVAPRRILGLDPGLKRTGYGVIERVGSRWCHRAHGVLRVPTEAALPARLAALFAAVRAVVSEHAPHAIAVEIVFVNVNPQATLLLGQARGAVLAAAASDGTPVAEYTALQVKQAVVGYGKASKTQVQEMVRRLLALPEPPSPDAADALACALAHAHQSAHPVVAAMTTLGQTQVRRRSGRLRGWDEAALAALSARRQ